MKAAFLILTLILLGFPGRASAANQSGDVLQEIERSRPFLDLYSRYAKAVQEQGVQGLKQMAVADFLLRAEGASFQGQKAFAEMGKRLDGLEGGDLSVAVWPLTLQGDRAVALTEETLTIPYKQGRFTSVSATWYWKQIWRKTASGWKLAEWERIQPIRIKESKVGFHFNVHVTPPKKPPLPSKPDGEGPAGRQQGKGASVPSGLIVYSAQVDASEYTSTLGRFDLFLQTTGDGKTLRLTDHRAHPELNLGGAITEPRFSPDGEQIRFLSDYADSPEEQRILYTDTSPFPYTFRNIWLLNLRTRAITPVTRGNLGWNQVSWSPNGRYFCAVYPSRSGTLQDIPPDDIYVFDARTLRKWRVARASDRVMILYWSADSKAILFQEWRGDNDLYKVAIHGGSPQIAVIGRDNRTDYDASPDGKFVTFVEYMEGSHSYRADSLYLLERATRKQSKVLVGVSNRNMPALSAWGWSPDGKRVAVMHWEDGVGPTRLYVLEAATGKLRLVTTLPGFASVRRWSKDGQWWIVQYGGVFRDGLLAVSVADGHSVTLHAPKEIMHGLDWHEGNLKP